MADELDSWCPACGRQVIPKRYVEEISVPTVVQPPIKKSGQRRKGRVVQPPVRTKIVRREWVDQAPVPLYCSDECRLSDTQFRVSGLPMRYDPQISSREQSTTTSSPCSRTSTCSTSSSDTFSDASSTSPDHLTAGPDSEPTFASWSARGVESKISNTVPVLLPSSSYASYASAAPRSAPVSAPSAWQGRSSDEALMDKYNSSFTRRAETRRKMFPVSSYKERSIVPDNVNLIVPNVKLRTRNHSLPSICPRAPSSASSTSSKPPKSEKTEEEPLFGFARSRARRMSPTVDRPGQVVGRSYSSPLIQGVREEEEGELLYDALPLRTSTNRVRTTRMEKQIQNINGVDTEVEVPVVRYIEITVAPKTLFGPQRVLSVPDY